MTYIYIDASNIIMSLKNLKVDLDMLSFITYLKDRYKNSKIIYFTPNFKSKNLDYLEIQSQNIEIVFKQIYNENNKLKANCDVEISHRITRDSLLEKVSEVVLISGDGDFVYLIDYLKNKNITVKIIAADPVSCSLLIKRRSFVKLTFIIDVIEKIHLKNEKPPTST